MSMNQGKMKTTLTGLELPLALGLSIFAVACDGGSGPPVCPDPVAEAAQITCECGLTYADPAHKCYKPDAYNSGSGSDDDPDADCALQPAIGTLEIRDLQLTSELENITITPEEDVSSEWTYFNPMNSSIDEPSVYGIADPVLEVTSGIGNPVAFTKDVPWSQLDPCGEDEQEHEIGALAAGSYTLQVRNDEVNFVGITSIPNFLVQ